MGFKDIFKKFKRNKQEVNEECGELNQSLKDIDEELADIYLKNGTCIKKTEAGIPQKRSLKLKTVKTKKVAKIKNKKTTPIIKKVAVKKKRAILPKKIKKKVEKKVIKTVKKTSTLPLPKKEVEKEKDLLNQAVMDLTKELRILRSAKNKLEKQMNSVSGELGSTQNQELELRDKISELMRKEALLVKKKTSAKDKMVLLEQRIEKVKEIGRELKSV